MNEDVTLWPHHWLRPYYKHIIQQSQDKSVFPFILALLHFSDEICLDSVQRESLWGFLQNQAWDRKLEPGRANKNTKVRLWWQSPRQSARPGCERADIGWNG